MNTEIAYPFQISPTGDLVTTSDRAEQCNQAILSVLNTREGERVYRPEYGLPEHLFTTKQMGVVLGSVRSALEEALIPEYEDCTFAVRGTVLEGATVAIVNYQLDDTTDTIRTVVT